jgi:tetrahydromethanopterin S-methyltransferase subunit G
MKEKLKKTKEESKTRDQYTVVLEGLRSDFKVFGEDLSLVRDKVDKIDKKADKIDVRLERVEGDLTLLKGEVALIRHNQVTRDEFKFLESRVSRLEQKMSH